MKINDRGYTPEQFFHYDRDWDGLVVLKTIKVDMHPDFVPITTIEGNERGWFQYKKAGYLFHGGVNK